MTKQSARKFFVLMVWLFFAVMFYLLVFHCRAFGAADSILIVSPNTSLIKMTYMERFDGRYNYGARTNIYVGTVYNAPWQWEEGLLQFSSAADSVATETNPVVDSVRLWVRGNVVNDVTDTVVVGLYPLRRSDWVEGISTNGIDTVGFGATWSWVTQGEHPNTGTAWGAEGAASTSEDMYSTCVDSFVFTSTTNAWYGATIPSTYWTAFRDNGIKLKMIRHGVDDTLVNSSAYSFIRSDDYTSDITQRPKITIYWHTMESPVTVTARKIVGVRK